MADFVDRWAAFWAAPDPARVGDLAATDIELRYPGLPEPLRGVEAWRARVASIVQRFPDVRLTVTAHATADDLCFVSWRGTATAAGNPITWEGIDRMRLRDGLVVDSLVAFDTAGLRPAV
ncbi:nuclear transport factor 2 family protein [Paractinoplanes abujensis]|uniref:Ketosteroid isomerase-like protein n=1 Tax=Paractinoplanes abujensis TaxID=882441 RepID=A0A7W7D3A7_9ACTN|nr:nuclear transport factor 2 family protein [Actinoplanes abujensis]MBB4698031.1 ketosteroid isomerase-like protein [Actinoplanes abujensis]